MTLARSRSRRVVGVAGEPDSLAVDLELRNPLRDNLQVKSRAAFEGRRGPDPLVTIVITVYKRVDYLFEAVASVLNQTFEGPTELIIVDDDPDSQLLPRLVAEFPQLSALDFTYYLNEKNLGLFGNWNRGILLARGKWVSILNDDDLLDAACLALLFASIARDDTIDAIIPCKRYLDQRAANGDAPRSGHGLGATLFGYARSLLLFRRRPTRRLTAGTFFWGNVTGNPVGFVFKKEVAIGLGGFFAEEYPSSDHLFFARVADRFHFRQHKTVSATFRVAANESLKYDTVLAGMQQSLLLQRSMVGRQVPRWWRHFIPMVMAYHRADGLRFLGADIPAAQVEKMLGGKLPKERPRLLALIRLLARGY